MWKGRHVSFRLLKNLSLEIYIFDAVLERTIFHNIGCDLYSELNALSETKVYEIKKAKA